ncbi:MAG TPA: nucleotide exchange factor GrpE [Candidatus Saccharimonadales bacterium]|nr:nucleotide exchange factor GrpE [Candidatus Saccharimonadales bacterium]
MSKKAKQTNRSSTKVEVEQTVTMNGSPDELQDRIDELTGDLQRLQAEFANYKRRESEAKAELLDMAKREVVLLLLPILDNIDRALTHRPDELKDNTWAIGVEQVGKQATEALTKLGVTKIESVGQPFDHNLHEAIAYEEGEGSSEVVVEELQPGYRMGDTVIRHAMVKVGRK